MDPSPDLLAWLNTGADITAGLANAALAITVLVLLKRIKLPFQRLGIVLVFSFASRIFYVLLKGGDFWATHPHADAWARIGISAITAASAILLIQALPGMVRVVLEARASERRQAALFEKTQLIELLLNTCPDPIFAFDREVRFTHWNPAVERLTGVPAPQALGKKAIEVFPTIRERGVEDMYLRTLQGESIRIEKKEFTYLTSGERGWYEAHWLPLRSPDNTVIGGLCLVRDITEATHREMLLAEQQMSLVESAKLRALGEMAGGMAHEINTPVSTIVLKADELRKLSGKLGEHEQTVALAAGKIQETAMRIGGIIQSLRTFSRDTHHDPFESVEVAHVLAETLNLCESRIRKHDIQLEIDLKRESLMIQCRPGQIVQVLINLLNNSFDAVVDQTHRKIKIGVTDDTTTVKLKVQDSGPGIPQEMLGRLMQPFATSKGVGKGTGLGLSISKGIVEAHGGALAHEHREEMTTFSVTLPKSQV